MRHTALWFLKSQMVHGYLTVCGGYYWKSAGNQTCWFVRHPVPVQVKRGPCPQVSLGEVLICLTQAFELGGGKTTKSVTHGQCVARPTVTFTASEHHHLLTDTKLYCLVTEAHRCKQLAKGHYAMAPSRDSNPRCAGQDSNQRPTNRKSNALLIMPLCHPRLVWLIKLYVLYTQV